MAKTPLYLIVWKEGKYFVSQCLNVDVSSFGNTREEAVTNLNEALELYFEDEGTVQHDPIEAPEIISVPLKYA